MFRSLSSAFDHKQTMAYGNGTACGEDIKTNTVVNGKHYSGVCIIYEDEKRSEALINAVRVAGVRNIQKWLLTSGSLDIRHEPSREILYFSRLSASAFIRNHSASIIYGEHVLLWLESRGCTVINGSVAFSLELSKMKQCIALEKVGIDYPETLVVSTREELNSVVPMWHRKTNPDVFYTKPVTGGSGSGVQRFTSLSEFQKSNMTSKSSRVNVKVSKSINPMHIVQVGEEEHEKWYDVHKKGKIKGEKKIFYRAEFVDRQFLYCLRISAPVSVNSACPCDAPTRFDTDFSIITEPGLYFDNKRDWDIFKDKCTSFMFNNNIHVCAFEFSKPTGKSFIVYDVNINTNYSDIAEKRISPDKRGMTKQAMMIAKMCA